jgi:transposase-like protein
VNDVPPESSPRGMDSYSDSGLAGQGPMPSSRRKFSREFKVGALKRLETATVADVARSCQIDPNVLRRWRRDFARAPESAFPGPGRSPDESRIAELQRQIARHTEEIDHLKEILERMEKQRGEKTEDASA